VIKSEQTRDAGILKLNKCYALFIGHENRFFGALRSAKSLSLNPW